MNPRGHRSVDRRVIEYALKALALVCALAPSVPASPSYRRYKLYELAIHAEVAASGTIVALDKETFELEVSDWVLGEGRSPHLTVRRFWNWTCAARWADYEVGQRVFVFLRAPDGKKPGYRILGAGGEGEMPIVGEDVFAEGHHVRDVEYREHDVWGVPRVGSLLDTVDLAEAVRGLRECVEVGDDPASMLGRVVKRRGCSEAATREYVASSGVARHLYESVSTDVHWEGAGSPFDLVPLGALPQIVAREGGGAVRLAEDERIPALQLEAPFGTGGCTFVGDVDGNGVADLAASGRSAVWIMLRDRPGEIIGSSRIRMTSLVPDGLPADHYLFGEAISSVRDLNDDGVPDLAIGAPRWDVRGTDHGGVWVVFLERDASVKRAVELGEQLERIGEPGYDELGRSLADLGDLDGDGLRELAVAAVASREVDGEPYRGHIVLILSLDRHARVRRCVKIDPRADGFGVGPTWFGTDVAALGDVDGDGVCDLAISDDVSSDGGSGRGAVWIVLLDSSGKVKSKQKISDWEGDFEGTLLDRMYFGRSLAAPGDFDGNGTPDLLVGGSGGIWRILLRPDGTVAGHREYRADSRVPVEPSDFGCSLAYDPATAELVVGGGFCRLWLLSFDRDWTFGDR